MDLELRTIRDDELSKYLEAVTTGFGMTSPDPDDEFPFHLLPKDRSLAVFDNETIVGTAGAYPFRIGVPGGARVPVAGVTMVTVHPTHRRRGLLRSMMDEQLDDVARRGEPLAALTASESSIYERFGYGIATLSSRWELSSEYATFAVAPTVGGSVRLVGGAEAMAAARAVYDVAARSSRWRDRPGRRMVGADLHAREGGREVLHGRAPRAGRPARRLRAVRDRPRVA